MNEKINVVSYGEETLDFIQQIKNENENDSKKEYIKNKNKENILLTKNKEKKNPNILCIKKSKQLKKEIDAWKKKYEIEKNRNVCQICIKQYKDTIIFPCLHWLYCNRCIVRWKRKNKTCPQCRMNIRSILQLNTQ